MREKFSLKRGEWAVAIFALIYIAGYTIYYVSIKDYEFLWYLVVLSSFFTLIMATIKRTKFDYLILWGLALWGFFHMSGGGIVVNGDVLYNYVIFPIIELGENTILKFDQFVHAFGFGVTTLVAWHLLKPYLNKKTNYKVVYPLLFFIAMGAGALNEVVEFLAVVFIPNTNVGGYYNTAIDLVSNGIGAVIALVVIHFRRR